MKENHEEQTEITEVPEAEITEEVMAEQEVVEKPKRSLKKLFITLGAIVVVLAIAVPLTYTMVFNNYRTPLKLAAAVENAKTFEDALKATTKQSNGLINKESKAILDILMDSEEFDIDDIEDLMEIHVDSLKEQYGDDYKFYYYIEDKEPLDQDDLKDIKRDIKDFAKEIKEEVLEETEDYDSDDWEDEADYFGVSKSEVKAMYNALEDIYETMKSVKITKGYELSVVLTVSGSELDEPEEYGEETTITVCKVNGRWICPDDIASMLEELLYEYL